MLATLLLGIAGCGPIGGWRRGRGCRASLGFRGGLSGGWVLGRKSADDIVDRKGLGARSSEHERDRRAAIGLHDHQVFASLANGSPCRRALFAQITRSHRVAINDVVVTVEEQV